MGVRKSSTSRAVPAVIFAGLGCNSAPDEAAFALGAMDDHLGMHIQRGHLALSDKHLIDTEYSLAVWAVTG